jgi:hypothetical protein
MPSLRSVVFMLATLSSLYARYARPEATAFSSHPFGMLCIFRYYTKGSFVIREKQGRNFNEVQSLVDTRSVST